MDTRITAALNVAAECSQVDGAHHKAWVIDQMVRELLGCPVVIWQALDSQGLPYNYEALGESQEYLDWIEFYKAGEDGPDTYDWDIGIAP